ncbi:MAG: YSC84-related protein [Bacteroidota bacterium]
MKLLRLFLAIAIISSVAISCKKSTSEAKEDLKEAVENAEEATEAAVDAAAEAAEDVQDAVNEVVESAGIEVNYPKDSKLQNEVSNSMVLMAKENPNVGKMFDKAYGYVVFPKIIKGGLGIGGAGGKGLVFEDNKVIGSATLMQATIGLQAGGQQYAEYIFFENKSALDKFKNNKFKFAGEASAVAIDKSISDNIDYQDGVAVYTHANKGLMAEASLGTQKFKYKEGIK